MTEALVLQAVIAALTHATELSQLYATMKAEGRTDLTDAEVAVLLGKAQSAVDALKKKP